MIISPTEIEPLLGGFERGARGAHFESLRQPNGVDLPVSQIYRVQGRSTFLIGQRPDFGKMYRRMRLAPDETFQLRRGRSYAVESTLYLSKPIPTGMAAIVICRSTFLRAGIFIQSALYDSGYEGTVGAMIFPFNHCSINPHYPFGQIVFLQAAESEKLYGKYYGNGMF